MVAPGRTYYPEGSLSVPWRAFSYVQEENHIFPSEAVWTNLAACWIAARCGWDLN